MPKQLEVIKTSKLTLIENVIQFGSRVYKTTKSDLVMNPDSSVKHDLSSNNVLAGDDDAH